MRLRRRLSVGALVLILLTAGSPALVAPPVAAQDPADPPPAETPEELVDPSVSQPADEPVLGSAPILEQLPGEVPVLADQPSGSGVVELSGSSPVPVPGLPLSVGLAGDDGQRLAAPVRVEVSTVDTGSLAAFRASPLAIEIERVDAIADPVTVRLQVDYSAFAQRFGGDWASRLEVVEARSCETGADQACAVTSARTIVNDLAEGVLEVEIVAGGDPKAIAAAVTATAGPLPPEGTPAPVGPVTASNSAPSETATVAPAEGVTSAATGSAPVFILSADPSGPAGTFEATPLAPSSEWEIGLQSGAFNWSYPIPVPPAVAGAAPDLTFGYSSGAIDGMTSETNNQGSWVGAGWDLSVGFIERRYKACAADGGAIADQCWVDDNATISFNGVSSALIPTGTAGEWRVQDDPGWRVRKVSGSPGSSSGIPVDNDGEYWEVTGTDGTSYVFGYGREPNSGLPTDSVWTAPVFGNNAGEPCYPSWCQQAWRWNLDRIVDPLGNVITYSYTADINAYGRGGGPGNVTPYARGGWLTSAAYTKRNGAEADSPPVRVQFDVQNRCTLLNADCDTTYPPSTANSNYYPDVPVDLLCSPTAGSCSELSPSFFDTRRLVAVRTEVLEGTGYRAVDKIQLTHQFPPTGETGVDPKLFVRSIQRIGSPGLPNELALPAIQFDAVGTILPNRADANPSAGVPEMRFFRIDTVSDEIGGQVFVEYGQPHPCTPIPVGAWHTNTRDCFPAYYVPAGGTAGFGAFHKYLVTRAEQRDLVGGSPPVQTIYTYEDTPAWHHDNDPYRRNSDQSWSDWRGYSKVLVATGPTGGTQTRTRHLFFRGMHEDRLTSTTTKTESVSTVGDAWPGVGAHLDYNWLRGRVLQVQQLDAAGAENFGEHHAYLWFGTAGSGRDGGYLTREQRMSSRTRDGASWQTTTTETAWDSYGNPTIQYDAGDITTAADDRCTRTIYAPNTTAWIVDQPYATDLLQGGCSSPTLAGSTRLFYDAAAVESTPPTVGLVTRQRLYTDASNYVDTTTSYDAYGRTLEDRDGRNTPTTTTYSPSTGFPTAVTVTNGLGHLSSTTQDPAWGVPRSTTDPTAT